VSDESLSPIMCRTMYKSKPIRMYEEEEVIAMSDSMLYVCV